MRIARVVVAFALAVAAAGCDSAVATEGSDVGAADLAAVETPAPKTPTLPREVRRTPAGPEVLARRICADWVAGRDRTPVRDVTVLCASDEEFRAACAGPWKDDVRARVARASAVFEREFRIRLVPVAYREWTTPATAADIHVLQRAAALSMPGDEADLAIVFVRQDAPASSRRDTYERGVTYYYGRTLLVRTGLVAGAAGQSSGGSAGGPQTHWPYEEETLLHEIAHTFGAWHTAAADSVMRAPKQGSPVIAFDRTASAAVVLCRGLDLRRGIESISDDDLTTITRLWRESRLPGTEHPVLDALQARGWVHEIAGRRQQAAADYERAVVLARASDLPMPRRLQAGLWRTWTDARGSTK